MSSLFQGLTDANGVVQTIGILPASPTLYRGIALDGAANRVVIREDTGQIRSFVGGIAVEFATGAVLTSGVATPFVIAPGGVSVDVNGSLQIKQGPALDVVHQGVALLNNGTVVVSDLENLWGTTYVVGFNGTTINATQAVLSSAIALNDISFNWNFSLFNVPGKTYRITATSLGVVGQYRIFANDPTTVLLVDDTDVSDGGNIDVTFTVPVTHQWWSFRGGTAGLTAGTLNNCRLVEQ